MYFFPDHFLYNFVKFCGMGSGDEKAGGIIPAVYFFEKRPVSCSAVRVEQVAVPVVNLFYSFLYLLVGISIPVNSSGDLFV